MVRIIVVFAALASFFAQANLVIHPIRVQFEPSTRSTEITLLNDSNKTNTYRLEWQEKKAIKGGGYIDLKGDDAKKFPTASAMVRFTPRQVTLKPGERQTVKLSVRRPARLAEGEYRSHLLFKALPPPQMLKSPEDQPSGLAMQMNVVTSFLIPVVVQQGAWDAQVSMTDAIIHYNAAEPNQSNVLVSMKRVGKHSVFGDVEAYWTPNGGKEVLIAKAAGFNSWPELNETSLKLGWVGAKFASGDGVLRVVFQGKRNYLGKTLFEGSKQLSRSDIKP